MSCSGGVYNNEVTMPSASPTEKKKYTQCLFYPKRDRPHRRYVCPCIGFYSFVYTNEGFMVVFKNS